MDEASRLSAHAALAEWATIAFERWAGRPPHELSAQHLWLANYGRLLSPEWSPHLDPLTGQSPRLLSVFYLIPPSSPQSQDPPNDPENGSQIPSECPRPLKLEMILPGAEASPEDLLQGYLSDLGKLGQPQSAAAFESFGHLLRKYAWTVPCTYGSPGVSLYEEVKALAALIYASASSSEPANAFTLAGGDLSGIQDFIYTITSRGAAKGLRGRSFFLQLLGDAVVRRLVCDLGLCWGNVVYEAGGNFLLLASADEQTESTLESARREINQALLAGMDGDLALVMAWDRIAADAIGDQGFARARQGVGAQLASAKDQRYLAEMRQSGWERLFAPSGRGAGSAGYCQVCHRELIEEDVRAHEEKCALCQSFEALAREIAHDDLWLTVEPNEGTAAERTWHAVLAAASGLAYGFQHGTPPAIHGDGYAYHWNDTAVVSGNRGYRFVANATPRIVESDVADAQRRHIEPLPDVGDVKDFELMAAQSNGIERVGVLRMDVDGLGSIFGEQLRASIAQLSALSAAMTAFFCGHLNLICDEVERDQRKTLYTIYAGGDDLFVVGAWDRMPALAERIRHDLGVYTGQHDRFTISGGVTLEGAHFPLYRAAEHSEGAEHEAKSYRRGNVGKDAICFLGTTAGWEEWDAVKEMRTTLAGLIDGGVPRSLLDLCARFHGQWAMSPEIATRGGPKKRFGRWVWMAAYLLTRMAQAHEKEKDALLRIQRDWIAGGDRMHWLGLAARWVDYESRGGTE